MLDLKRSCFVGCFGSVCNLLRARIRFCFQTLDIVAENPDKFRVVGLAAGSNITLLADQVFCQPYLNRSLYSRDTYLNITRCIVGDTLWIDKLVIHIIFDHFDR